MCDLKRILYIESGMTGGGSAESLYQHLKVLDRSKYLPFVLFVNRNRYYDRITHLGINCVIFFDWLYNKEFQEAHPKIVKWGYRIQHAFAKWCPPLTLIVEQLLHIFLIRRLVLYILENNISLVHTNNQVHRDFYAIESARRAMVPCIAHIRSFGSEGIYKKKKISLIKMYIFL